MRLPVCAFVRSFFPATGFRLSLWPIIQLRVISFFNRPTSGGEREKVVKKKIEKRRKGWAVFAALALAVVFAACSEGSPLLGENDLQGDEGTGGLFQNPGITDPDGDQPDGSPAEKQPVSANTALRLSVKGVGSKIECGKALAATVTASGGIGVIRWTKAGLPDWLSAEPSGSREAILKIAGAMPYELCDEMTTDVVVTACDEAGTCMDLPVAIKTKFPKVWIATTLRNRTVTAGAPVEIEIKAKGGSGEYVWTKVVDNTPPEISPSDGASYTFSTSGLSAGTHTVVIGVRDGGLDEDLRSALESQEGRSLRVARDEKTFTVTITDPAAAPPAGSAPADADATAPCQDKLPRLTVASDVVGIDGQVFCPGPGKKRETFRTTAATGEDYGISLAANVDADTEISVTEDNRTEKLIIEDDSAEHESTVEFSKGGDDKSLIIEFKKGAQHIYTLTINIKRKCHLGKVESVGMYVYYDMPLGVDLDLCDETVAENYLLDANGNILFKTGGYFLDMDNSDSIDKQWYSFTLMPGDGDLPESVCLEEIAQVRWWSNFNGCAEKLDYLKITKIRVEANATNPNKTWYNYWNGEFQGSEETNNKGNRDAQLRGSWSTVRQKNDYDQ